MLIAGILLAGGIGKRIGFNIPKQFIKIGEKKLIEYSYEKLVKIVDFLVIVSHKDYIDETKKLFSNNNKLEIIEGGETRQLSVYNGLKFLKNKNCDIVIIHDSARPFFTIDLLNKCIEITKEKESAIPVIKEKNTVAFVSNYNIIKYIDRDNIYLIQTPQVFKFKTIMHAHEIAFKRKKIYYTDDSQILYLVKVKPTIVNGEEYNIKITTPIDLYIAETFVKQKIL